MSEETEEAFWKRMNRQDDERIRLGALMGTIERKAENIKHKCPECKGCLILIASEKERANAK